MLLILAMNHCSPTLQTAMFYQPLQYTVTAGRGLKALLKTTVDVMCDKFFKLSSDGTLANEING